MEPDLLSLIPALVQLPEERLVISQFLEALNASEPKVVCSYDSNPENGVGEFELLAAAGHSFGRISFDKSFLLQPVESQMRLRAAVGLLALLLENRRLQESISAGKDQVLSLFDQFPLCLLEEDFSQVKTFVDMLRSQGIVDFRAHFNSNPDQLAYCGGLIAVKSVNQYTARLYGYPNPQAFLEDFKNVQSRGVSDVVREQILAIADGANQFNWEGKDELIKGEERYHHLQWLVYPGHALEYGRIIVAITDVTEHHRILDALRESEERFSLAVTGANDGIWDWDLRSNRLYFSTRWKGLLGFNESELGDSPDEWIGRIHPEDIDHVKQEIDAHLAGQTANFVSEHRIFTSFGSYRWFLVRGLAVREPGEKARRMAGSLTDINPRKMIEERLVHDAMHDPLTNLPNRTYFIDQLRRSIERSRRHVEYQAAILVLDVDRFRLVNESLGHPSGDRLLMAISERLLKCVRAGDCLARFSGDNFAILLEDINGVGGATRIATRILAELDNSFDLKGQEVFTSVSIGIVMLHAGYQSADDLLRDAESALNRAKSGGRGHYQIFDPKIHAQSLALLQVEADMRRAIENHEFVLYYQPIVSLSSGKITTVEALIRWQTPDRGLILPAEFIPLAEETGLIQPIGEWVLYTACRQAKEWEEAGFSDLHVSINISARQFQEQDLIELVSKVIRETGVDAKKIQLEITESIAMVDVDITVRILNEMNQMGVRVSIDDFGASYSSLGYLKRFPVNKLKIDLSFIHDIPGNKDDSAITAAMIAMGHILDLGVISEGVETHDQLAFLISRDCDEAQGFLFAHALAPDAITSLLKSGRNMLHA